MFVSIPKNIFFFEYRELKILETRATLFQSNSPSVKKKIFFS